jgi:effector-binding domain-containing protein
VGYEIEVIDAPEVPTAVVAMTTTWPELPAAAGAAFDEVWALVRAEDLRTDGHNVILYWDGLPSVEVGVQVIRTFEPTGRVAPSVLPAGTVARTVHRGSYEHLAAAHDAVHVWCKDNGYELAGPRWEIYGDWHEDADELETEVVWLVAG